MVTDCAQQPTCRVSADTAMMRGRSSGAYICWISVDACRPSICSSTRHDESLQMLVTEILQMLVKRTPAQNEREIALQRLLQDCLPVVYEGG